MRSGSGEFVKTLVVNPAAAGVFGLGALVVAIVAALSSPVAAAVIAAVLLVSVVVILGYGMYTRERFGGLYEILNEEITWDLVSVDGSEVDSHKKLEVQYLQNNVLVWVDYAWGDGEVMAEYTCKPGALADHFSVGERLWLINSLQAVRGRGQRETLHAWRKVRNGFTLRREWVSYEIIEPTRSLKLTIIFPRERPCLNAWKSSKRGPHPSEPIDVRKLAYTQDGRQLLVIDEKRPRVGKLVTITWDW